MNRTLLSLLLVLTCSWSSDLTSAIDKARVEKRPLLLFFSGSGWSGWSMKFKDEVLSQPEFQEKVEEQLLLVEIETPQHPDSSHESSRFDVNEFPTLLLLSHDEREIARFGYMPMKGDQLADDLLFILAQDRDLAYLVNLLQRGETTQSILKKAYHLAEELCNEEAIEKVLDYGIGSKEPGFFLVEKYRRSGDERLREKLLEIDDPDLLYHMALIDFQDSGQVEPLESYLARYGERAGEYRWQLEIMIAQYYLEQDKVDLAIEHGEIAQESAPEKRQEEITHTLDYMRSCER